jgi:hypothetical protein
MLMLCSELAGSAAPTAAILSCTARGLRVGDGWIECLCSSCSSLSDATSVNSVTTARSSFLSDYPGKVDPKAVDNSECSA